MPHQQPEARMTHAPLIIFGAGAIGRALAAQALADAPERPVHIVTRSGAEVAGAQMHRVAGYDDASIEVVAASIGGSISGLIIALGLLHAPGIAPEKAFRQLDAEAMAAVFAANAITPALILRHMLPLLPRNAPGFAAAISARVGSISDNRLGGWVSYRASKAALNQVIRCAAIEFARTHKQATIIGLHPGTVDSALSAPFQGNVPEGKLFTPETSAAHLWRVIHGATPAQSGRCFAWDGAEIAPSAREVWRVVARSARRRLCCAFPTYPIRSMAAR